MSDRPRTRLERGTIHAPDGPEPGRAAGAAGAVRIVVACALALALLAAGCGSASNHQTSAATTQVPGGGREPANEHPKDGGSMVIAVPAESDSWNPAVAEWAAAGSLVGSSVLEPLAKLNSRGGADPWLATSWIADSSFDRWEIHLRANVMFQDGEPFNADAVKLNLDTYVNGALTGQVLKPMVKDVRVLDPLTVVVDLTQPWAAFPSSYLDGGGSFMMAPAMIHSSDGGATHPIGTGPFIFQSWTPGGSFKVKKNPNYWQKGLPHLDSIEFRVITDESTSVAALQSGDVNMILSTSAQDADRLANSYTVVKNWDSESVSALANTVSNINGKFNPLSNIHARLALAYATDRSQIASEVGAGVLTTTGPFTPSGPWAVPDSQSGYVNYDPTKAKQELTTYEQETGQSSLNFTLAGVSDVNTVKLLQELQAQWKRVGINAQLQTMDQPSLIKQLVAAEFQSVLLNSYNYPDPDTSRVFWTSETVKGVGQININFNMYKSAQMDADLHAGRVEGYINQRKVAYTDLEHQINSAVLNIWLYHTPYTLIADHNVRGLNDARDIAFGNFEPKTWLGNLWLTNA